MRPSEVHGGYTGPKWWKGVLEWNFKNSDIAIEMNVRLPILRARREESEQEQRQGQPTVYSRWRLPRVPQEQSKPCNHRGQIPPHRPSKLRWTLRLPTFVSGSPAKAS